MRTAHAAAIDTLAGTTPTYNLEKPPIDQTMWAEVNFVDCTMLVGVEAPLCKTTLTVSIGWNTIVAEQAAAAPAIAERAKDVSRMY
jgi:hypothetical protein